MKISHSLYLLLLSGLMAASCKKANTTIPAGMSCNAGNAVWTAASSYAFVTTYSLGPLAPVQILQTGGYKGDPNTSPAITLTVYNYSGQTGAYTISASSNNAATYVDPSTGASYNAASGTITLSKITPTNVQGTFNFKTDSFSGNFTVTGGEFNINLQ